MLGLSLCLVASSGDEALYLNIQLDVTAMHTQKQYLPISQEILGSEALATWMTHMKSKESFPIRLRLEAIRFETYLWRSLLPATWQWLYAVPLVGPMILHWSPSEGRTDVPFQLRFFYWAGGFTFINLMAAPFYRQIPLLSILFWALISGANWAVERNPPRPFLKNWFRGVLLTVVFYLPFVGSWFQHLNLGTRFLLGVLMNALLSGLFFLSEMPTQRRPIAWELRTWLIFYRYVIRPLGWFRIEGVENIPSGRALLAGSHPYAPWDFVFVASEIYAHTGRIILGLADAEHLPFWAYRLFRHHVIGVKKGGTVDAIVSELKLANPWLLIFPSGRTERRVGLEGSWKSGVAQAAIQSNSPIIPFHWKGAIPYRWPIGLWRQSIMFWINSGFNRRPFEVTALFGNSLNNPPVNSSEILMNQLLAAVLALNPDGFSHLRAPGHLTLQAA